MNYKELNDNELVYLCNDNNEEAANILINKYKGIILSTLKEYMKEYNVYGIDISDLYQEGLIGLVHAIQTYKHERDTTFYTYALKCIKNNLMTALKKTFRMKNRILNNSYSLDNLIEESNSSFYELLTDEKSDPNNLLIDEEETENIINLLKGKLSKNEKTIFDLKLKGLSNTEISELIDKDKKFVENTLFRISKKYKELF